MSIGTREDNVKAEEQEFRNKVKPIWCPGCGDHAVLNALTKILAELGLTTKDVAVVTGIGCSSRLPGYMGCYGFNSIHGRALPIATGLKLSRPLITVIAAGGDGDGFAIGGNHLMHAARRNIDITYIMMDNGIYGLTKGQVSPTTPKGMKTKTTAYGAYEKPVNPTEVMLAYGSSFVAKAFAGNIKHLQYVLMEAVKFRGFSFVDVISPCTTYMGGAEQYKMLRDQLHILDPEEHDEHDWDAAHALTRDETKLNVGVFFRERMETYLETQVGLRERVHESEIPPIESLAEMYK
jgi:2-oxoglutarate ferredoxin oxidoreductase subunit beta